MKDFERVRILPAEGPAQAAHINNLESYGEQIVEETRAYTGAGSKEEVLTTLKILLSGAGIPVTDGNLACAAEWLRSIPRDQAHRIRHTKSLVEKRGLIKSLRKAVNRYTRAHEHQFLEEATGNKFDAMVDGVKNMPQERVQREIDKSPYYRDDVAEIARRFQGGIHFERPQGTSLHHFLDDLEQYSEYQRGAFDMFKNDFHSFVIEHDWSKAFQGVKDFDGGEIKLPFAYTCFEFRLNGIRLLVFLGEMLNGERGGVIASGINKRWYVNPMRVLFDGERLYHPEHPDNTLDIVIVEYLKLLGAQIRAVCIMLDAGVAVGEEKLASEQLQKKRQREGRAPLRSYHVVCLAKRFRHSHEAGEPTGIQKRLHWRRGHWRHFQTPGGEVQYINEDGITVSKTWINWMLVGNENLGFIEKHYRL